MRARAGRLIALGCLLATLSTSGCGKKGSPLPPIRVLPEPVERFQVRQSGDELLVSFRRPGGRTDGTPLSAESDLVLYLSAREPPPRSPREVVDAPAVSWVIPSSRWSVYARGGSLEIPLRLSSIASALEIPGGGHALAGRRLSFAVQVREPGRRHSAAAGVASIAACAAPDPPARVEAVAEEAGVRVSWDVPAGGAPREGFRVFRNPVSVQKEPLELTSVPVAAPPLLDTTYTRGEAGRYIVRAVARGQAACESAGAASAPVAWVDLFPPAAPQGLAAVEERGAIRLFWRPNREADLRGYLVYRAVGVDGSMERLTSEPLEATSWTDATAAPGIVYIYSVTAVDSAQPSNESRKSEPATEQLEESR